MLLRIFSKLKQYGYIHDIETEFRCLKKKHVIELPVKKVHKPNGKINLFTDPIKMFDLIILKYRSKYYYGILKDLRIFILPTF